MITMLVDVFVYFTECVIITILRYEKKMAFTSNSSTFNYILIVVIQFLYMFSLFIAGTAMPQFVYKYFRSLEGLDSTGNSSTRTSGCTMKANSSSFTDQTKVQQETAQYEMYNTVITFVPAVLYSIIIGPVSDLKGRKLLLIIGTVGTLVLFGTSAVVAYFQLNIYFMYVGHFIYGSSGSFASVVQATNAYMADVTPADKKRSFGVTLLAAGTGVASIVGTFIAGYMIEGLGFISNFLFAFGFTGINLILIVCFLQETVVKREINYRKQAANSVKELISFYTGSKYKGNRWKYILLILALTFTFLRDMGMSGLEKLFVMNNPFCWGPIKISYFFAIKTLAFNVVGLILVKVLQYCTNDVGIALLGSLSTAGFFVIYAFSDTDLLLYCSVAVGVLGDMVFPMIRASLSKMTPAEKQGAVFSGTCVVETLCVLFSGIMMSAIYKATVGFMKGFVFLLAAGYSVICVIILGILLIRGRNESDSKDITKINISTNPTPSECENTSKITTKPR